MYIYIYTYVYICVCVCVVYVYVYIYVYIYICAKYSHFCAIWLRKCDFLTEKLGIKFIPDPDWPDPDPTPDPDPQHCSHGLICYPPTWRTGYYFPSNK